MLCLSANLTKTIKKIPRFISIECTMNYMCIYITVYVLLMLYDKIIINVLISFSYWLLIANQYIYKEAHNNYTYVRKYNIIYND